jgi:hypothetical protein
VRPFRNACANVKPAQRRTTSEGFALRPPSSPTVHDRPIRVNSLRDPRSVRPTAAARCAKVRSVSDRLATPKVAGQMRYLLMWSGRLTVPRPPRTCHNVTDPGPQEDLAAEPSPSRKPGRSLAQVNRQLPGAEVAVLSQAPADRGLRHQHRQTELGRVLARVGPPALLIGAS